jgi:hypothetical protein
MRREYKGGGAKAKKAEPLGRSSDLCFVERKGSDPSVPK